MAWTDKDEADFIRRRNEHIDQKDKEDAERASLAKIGLSPKCPNCGSHRYSEGIRYETCNDCGVGQRY